MDRLCFLSMALPANPIDSAPCIANVPPDLRRAHTTPLNPCKVPGRQGADLPVLRPRFRNVAQEPEAGLAVQV